MINVAIISTMCYNMEELKMEPLDYLLKIYQESYQRGDSKICEVILECIKRAGILGNTDELDDLNKLGGK